MQTFLPYAGLQRSLQTLDNARLGKQRIEAKYILDVLLGNLEWKNHPAIRMWKGYENALIRYYNFSLNIWESRNKENNLKPIPILENLAITIPPWFGNEAFHASHRSRLLFKGKLDLLAKRIHLHPDCKGKAHGLFVSNLGKLHTFSMLNQREYDFVNQYLDLYKIPKIDESQNFYLQYGWTEPDNLEYVWPN